MTSNIYKLLYVSAANVTLDEQGLLDILEQARRNNQKNGLTGLLLFAEGSIIQLLEGEKEAVDNTFQTIAQDSRHTGIIKLIAEYADSRDFSDWSMGFKRIQSKSLDEIAGFNDLLENKTLEENQLADISNRMRTLFETFRKTARV